ncbi:hypothetical protein D0865_14423 [Hortaea werneckii]|uniref:Uncharacterized protein n=1 Tax=Hortaea werneckii TaxID=91943 RepID=A0A3M7B1D9_HORWE|nr:hypothetical protein D0865_14423 [Hortaea werneckii]
MDGEGEERESGAEYGSQHLTQPTQPRRFSINLTSFNLSRPTSDPTTSENDTPTRDTFPANTASSPQDPHPYPHRPSSTTLGLVIHAAADGIALGASSTTTTSSNLSLIIFLALLIHKTPASFGLTTTLLKQGLSKRRARFHLLIFSLAAPVGALVTWFGAGFVGYGTADGGEVGEEGDGGGREFSVGGGAAGRLRQGKGTGMVELLVTVGGMLLPLLTQLGGGHAH